MQNLVPLDRPLPLRFHCISVVIISTADMRFMWINQSYQRLSLLLRTCNVRLLPHYYRHTTFHKARRETYVMTLYQSRVFNTALWLIHTARDRDRDRDQKMMGFYITLCTIHTIQGQGQVQGIIVFYYTHPVPCPGPGSCPVQCVWAISLLFFCHPPSAVGPTAFPQATDLLPVQSRTDYG